jgi:hypothetical protein
LVQVHLILAPLFCWEFWLVDGYVLGNFSKKLVHTSYNSVVPSEADLVWRIKYKLPRIQKYITNSKYWKNNNKNGEKMEFIRLHSLRSWFKLPENDKKQHQIKCMVKSIPGLSSDKLTVSRNV